MRSNANEFDTSARSTAMLALHRAAAAVSHPGGATLFEDLVRELADVLDCDVVFMATFTDDTQTRMRTLAAVLDGRLLARFEYTLAGTPCAAVVGHDFRFVAQGVADEFPAGTLFRAKGMDGYAGYPLNDSAGAALGMLVAMSRAPMRDPALAEALLKIFAARVVAELERERADEALRSAALAVSSTPGVAVFPELVRYLATIVRVDMAFIALLDKDDAAMLDILALHLDGQTHEGWKYPIAGTPCETVVGQCFRAYVSGLAQSFPLDTDLVGLGADSYAGYPLADAAGRPIGLVSVVSRRPLANVARIESMLQIFAVRAAAEVERLRADEALRRSEASYRAIFEGGEVSIFIHDWDSGAVVDVNPKACSSHGYSREELCHSSVGDISSGEQTYTQAEAMRRIEEAKHGHSPPFEWHRRNKDGSLHWDEVVLKPVEIGGTRYVVAFSREITERKAAEEALKLREEQYRVIFEASSDAFVLRDSKLRIVDVNPAFLRLFGFAPEHLQSATGYPPHFPPDYVEERRNYVRRALAGEGAHVETTLLHVDGSSFEADVRVIPVRYRDEPHVLSVVRDITERKQAERALRVREEQYRAIFDGASDAMALWSHDMRIVDVNRAFTPMFGYTREESIGAVFGVRLAPEERERRKVLFEQALAGQETQLETISVRRNGERFNVELRYLPIEHRGEPHVLAVSRDITARRRAEAQHAELEARLRQAQKMEAIGQLTGGIAHDFNNILTSVIGYVVMAGERAEPLGDARLVHQLEQAHVAAQRARDFVAQMLTFARRERGERHALALPALVRRTVQLLRATLPSSIELDADTDDATPAVQADAVQLEQVLFNLCINARDAIGNGSGNVRVRLRQSEVAGCHCASCRARVAEGRWVELSVADSGSGIAPEVLERMFDPFYTTKEVGRGSGMGLAMVHGIVHDHGGHLCVETRPGAGSRFRVLLPRAAAQAADPAAANQASPAGAPLAGRVLLVEDDAMVGELMTELLESWGLDVVPQRDPLLARDWLADPAQACDLLITDQTMPKLTGLELARQARLARPALPVLLYSGNAGVVDAAALQSSGVSQALRKPVDPATLRSVVGQWLDGRGGVHGGG